MSVLRTIGLASWLVASVACTTGGPANSQERVKRLEAKLSKEIGTAVKLECPTMIDGHAHYCSAVVAEEGKDDIVFPVRVTSRGDDLHYATKRWVTAAHMEKLGTHALKEKLDIPIEKLTCPKVSHMPDGATARCEATAEGIAIPVEASMITKVRKLHFVPVGGVVFAKDAARAAHEMVGKEGAYADVKCAKNVVVSKPGKRFQCTATMPDKTTKPIHFLITSKDGKFELGTEPPKAP